MKFIIVLEFDVVITDMGMPCDCESLETEADTLQTRYSPKQGARLINNYMYRSVETWKFDARSQGGLALSSLLDKKGVNYKVFTVGHGIERSLVPRTSLEQMDEKNLNYIQDIKNSRNDEFYRGNGNEVVKAGDAYFTRSKTISNWYVVIEDALIGSSDEQRVITFDD